MNTNRRRINQARIDIDSNELLDDGERASFESKRELRKAKRRRKKIIARIILIIVAVALAAWITLLILNNNGALEIEKISVKGNTYYNTETIIKYSGVNIGMGMLSAKDKNIKEGLEGLQYIKSVSILRKYPHKLIITVKERAPEYAVYSGGYYILLDKDLYVLNKSNDSAGLNIIEGFVPNNIKIGKKFMTDDIDDFKMAIKLSDIITENKIEIDRISHRNSIMRIYLNKNMVCEGTYDNLSKYINKLSYILEALNSKGIERATIYIGDNDYISFSPRIE